MDRCLKEKAFRGMKLHSPACGIDLVEDQHFEALSKVFKWSQENEVAILIHPFSGSETLAQVERFWSLVEKHSGLTIIIAHNGTSGGYSDISHMMLSGFLALKEKALKAKADQLDSSKIYFDLSGAVLLEETDGMAATTDENCLRLAATMPRVGWDRFLYASDYPVFTRDQMKTVLHDKLKLTPDQVAEIMKKRVSSLKWPENPASKK